MGRRKKEESKYWKAKHKGKNHFPHQSAVQERPAEIPNAPQPCRRSFQVLVFLLFHVTFLLHPPLTHSSQEASQGRDDLLWPAQRAKELSLIDLVCFLPKFLFCSSCHEDALVRRMCLKRSMTSWDVVVTVPQHSHSKLLSDSREQAWILWSKHSNFPML